MNHTNAMNNARTPISVTATCPATPQPARANTEFSSGYLHGLTAARDLLLIDPTGNTLKNAIEGAGVKYCEACRGMARNT
ncbi:hypothetical protein [Andreprevotia chitinilytica]|uniref:hypothetical protein n=1 Tax=Andreprevotia chitinilytica TaxID=396808 RepID=UPI000551BE19|nr:hypothetical protein [Andreprevotia chitinilytica]